MQVTEIESPPEFLARAGSLLTGSEIPNNLIVGLANALVNHPDRFSEFRLWIAEERDEPVAAALRTPPHNLVLADLPSQTAAQALAQHLASEELPGAVGTRPGIEWFADGWCSLADKTKRLTMDQGIFALENVRPISVPSGWPRRAEIGDRDQIVRWIVDFARDALVEHEAPEVGELEIAFDWRLKNNDPLSQYWVWEIDGQLVSVSGHGGATPNGVRIGPVYTPPGLRGHGYATGLVAAQSQWLLDQGRRYCFLYTDLSNPTSNAIYRRIGYEQKAESAEYRFG